MQCRYCDTELTIGLGSIGRVHRAGLFSEKPASGHAPIELSLLLCSNCKLVQLADTGLGVDELYGADYGYRSGLNSQMVTHLSQLASLERSIVGLKSGAVVLEIGANDGTHLRCFDGSDCELVAVDPTLHKFERYYDFACRKLATFFPTPELNEYSGRVSLIASHSCFYDLPEIRPVVSCISDLLEDGGIWSFEQSYLPLMLQNNAFDSICDEHLEYYSLHFIERLLGENRLKLERVSFNKVNGGSIHVIARKSMSRACYSLGSHSLESGFGSVPDIQRSFKSFWDRVYEICDKLHDVLSNLRERGPVYAVGASTKGSIILQRYQIGSFLSGVLEVNEDKFGKYMAGTDAQIIDERECELSGSSVLILPWHYGEPIVKRYLDRGANVILPLPTVEVFYAK